MSRWLNIVDKRIIKNMLAKESIDYIVSIIGKDPAMVRNYIATLDQPKRKKEIKKPPAPALPKKNETVYATRPVNWNKKKMVRIDARTSIYIDQDADPTEEIIKYKAREELKKQKLFK